MQRVVGDRAFNDRRWNFAKSWAHLMVMVRVSVELKGPAFERPGIKRAVGSAAQRAIQELVEEGEELLSKILRPRPAGVYLSAAEAGARASTGNYRRNISGRVSSGVGIITDGGVVYGPWLEGVSNRNQTTRFKGYGAFRKVQAELDRKAKATLDRSVRREIRRLR